MEQNKIEQKHKVIVYTTPTCPYCVTLKAFLHEHQIPYEHKDASDPQVQQEMFVKCQCFSVPVIDIDGKIIVGFNRQEICTALDIKE